MLARHSLQFNRVTFVFAEGQARVMVIHKCAHLAKMLIFTEYFRLTLSIDNPNLSADAGYNGRFRLDV